MRGEENPNLAASGDSLPPIPPPPPAGKGQPRATSKASITARRRLDQPPLPAAGGVFNQTLRLQHLKSEFQVGGPLGPVTKTTIWAPRGGQWKQQSANAQAAGTWPGSAQAPEATHAGSWSPEAGHAHIVGGNGSEIRPSSLAPRFCPILATLGEPTSIKLDVFPREVFASVSEREGGSLRVKYSRATGLRADSGRRKSAVG